MGPDVAAIGDGCVVRLAGAAERRLFPGGSQDGTEHSLA